MQNKRPIFTDKELFIIEDILGHYKKEGKRIREIFSNPDINDIFWKCKFYRIGFRDCNRCGKHKECKDLSEKQYCKECLLTVQNKCYHGCFEKSEETYDWICSDCGKVDNDLGGCY